MAIRTDVTNDTISLDEHARLHNEMAAQINAGFIGTKYKGEYSPNQAYAVGDMVTYQGTLYENITATTGSATTPVPFNAASWKIVQPPSPAPIPIYGRKTVAVSTASLLYGAIENVVVDMGLAYRLYRIETSRPARVRVYASEAQRTADRDRNTATEPTGDHGVVLDYLTTSTLLAADLSPLIDGADLDPVPDRFIPLAITNMGDTGIVTVTLTYLRTE